MLIGQLVFKLILITCHSSAVLLSSYNDSYPMNLEMLELSVIYAQLGAFRELGALC